MRRPYSDYSIAKTSGLLDISIEEVLETSSQHEDVSIPDALKIDELTEKERQQFFATVAPFGDKVEESDFLQREKTQPPPRTGDNIQKQFPVDSPEVKPKDLVEEEKKASSSPLSVLRYSPEGNQRASISTISVTFSQPMIALNSIDEIEKLPVPVTIAPIPSKGGKFSWKGTQTIIYEANYRFDMATEYVVTISQGTKSAKGGTLDKDVEFKFRTPGTQCKAFAPSGVYPVNELPLFYTSFDQEVSPGAVLPFITVKSKLSTFTTQVLSTADVKLKLDQCTATNGRLKTYISRMNRLMEKAPVNRHLWFTINEQVPMDTSLEVVIAQGVPSLEGPLPSVKAFKFSLKTYPAFKYLSHNSKPYQYQSLQISFSNPIDSSLFSEDMVTVSPPVKDMDIQVFNRVINIAGKLKGCSVHKVAVSQNLSDIFGNSLPKSVNVTFKVDEVPGLSTPYGFMAIMDGSISPPMFQFSSFNIKQVRVTVNQVTPDKYNSNLFTSRRSFRSPGKLVSDSTVTVQTVQDVWIDTYVDLTKYLQHPQEKVGHLFVTIEPKEWTKTGVKPVCMCWVQVSNMRISTFGSLGYQNYVWCVRADGQSTEGADVTFGNHIAKLDSTGMAVLTGNAKTSAEYVLCKHNKDSVFTTNFQMNPPDCDTTFAVMIFNEKGIFKPNEEVNLKGYIRDIIKKNNGSYFILGIPSQKVLFKYVVSGAMGQEITKGECLVSSFGTFHIQFKLPDNVDLGTCRVSLTTDDSKYYANHSFSVQEYRVPEYNVTTSIENQNNVVNGSTVATISALYYSGGPLSDATVTWYVAQTNTVYTPPGWNKFKFETRSEDSESLESTSHQTQSTTDDSGTSKLQILFNESARKNKVPVKVSVSCNVRDINNQTIGSSTSFIVHPSNIYLGYKCDRYCVATNTEFPVEIIAVNVEGKPVQNVPIVVNVNLVENVGRKEKLRLISSETKQSGLVPISHNLSFTQEGQYRVGITTEDTQGLKSSTSLTLYAYQGASSSKASSDSLIIVPDKSSYVPGEVAQVFVQSTFAGPSSGLLVAQRAGIIDTQRFEITSGTSTVLSVPILKEYLPSVTLLISLYGIDSDKDDKKSTTTCSGSIQLDVPPTNYELRVEVTPEKTSLTPGDLNKISVQILDFVGTPKSKAEVVIYAVDEAVLSLSGYSKPDLLAYFHNNQPEAYSYNPFDEQLESKRRMKSASVSRSSSSMSACDDCEDESDTSYVDTIQSTTTEVRSNFQSVAFYIASAVTDSQGQVTAEVKMPDSITRYKVFAVACFDNSYFGTGEASITCTFPIQVRPSFPRFLNYGDKADMSCVITNQTEKNVVVNAYVRTLRLDLAKKEMNAFKFVLKALSRNNITIPILARQTGISKIQIGIEVNDSGIQFKDVVEKSIPVALPASSEAFATYFEVDGNDTIFLPVVPPKNIIPQFGGLEITSSSTAVQSLTDAFVELVNNKYEGNEQISSRILAIAGVHDVLSAFNSSNLPREDALREQLKKDVAELTLYQRADGAFGFWKSNRKEQISPYISIQVAHCFVRCKLRGYDIYNGNVNKSLVLLQNIENLFSAKMTKKTKFSLRAYALYVLALADHKSIATLAPKLWKEAGTADLSLEGLAWVMYALFKVNKGKVNADVTNILKYIQSRVNENAGMANFITSYGDSMSNKLVMLHSNTRTDAIILEALINVVPKDTLIPKIVHGLLARRKKGRWNTSQENAFVMLALHKYFVTFENLVPNFTVQSWFGEYGLGTSEFKGRKTERHIVTVPNTYVALESSTKDLVISKKGEGRGYFRVGLSYTPDNLRQDLRNYGFIVERSYEHVTDSNHVRKDVETGKWMIKSGELVKVKITVTNVSKRYQVALVDKLPAGLEAMNPDLPVTVLPPADSSTSSLTRTWYEHQSLRDERVECFTSVLPVGVHKYSYTCRATTKGEFEVPSTVAEEMYCPEIFGRSASDQIVVY